MQQLNILRYRVGKNQIRPDADRLKLVTEFPLKQQEVSDFEEIKKSIAAATLQSLDESLSFTIKCDASKIAVSATLNQNGQPSCRVPCKDRKSTTLL